MTTTVEKNKQDMYEEAHELLNELYQSIDLSFVYYFVSLAAPGIWRLHVEKDESDYRKSLQEEGYSKEEVEKRVSERDHIFAEGDFIVQTRPKILRKILVPGSFENFQAKKVIQTIYDDWESTHRVRLKTLLAVPVTGDIWGDLRHIRQSIAHRRCIGVDGLKNVKLVKDFLPGQEIFFTPTIMEKIHQELRNWYTEFLMVHFSYKI